MKLVQEKIQKNLLDFKLNKNVYRRTIMIVDYSKLINHLNDKEINVVDVGVRNGMSLLGDLSKFSRIPPDLTGRATVLSARSSALR